MRQNSCKGFSLIEVTICLAIIAVALIAIIGLLPHGVQASREAADNTIAATIVQDVFSSIRAASFGTVDLSAFSFTPAGPYNLQNPNAGVQAYFQEAGTPVNSPATTPQDCYFRVVLNMQPQLTPARSVITATISWPVKPGMVAPFLNTTTFVTQVAQYN